MSRFLFPTHPRGVAVRGASWAPFWLGVGLLLVAAVSLMTMVGTAVSVATGVDVGEPVDAGADGAGGGA